MPSFKENTAIINAVQNSNEIKELKEISEKYNISLNCIITKKNRLNAMKYPVKKENNQIICFKCRSPENLVLHHNHSTGKYIAVVCHSCNIKIGKNELKFELEDLKERIINLYEFHGLKTIKRILEREGHLINESLIYRRLREWKCTFYNLVYYGMDWIRKVNNLNKWI